MPLNLGISIRNMGTQSTPEIMGDIAVLADQAGLHSLWVTDHIAIPPDDAEGSGGRYVDPLATLAWLAGKTTSICLGTSVLILPYREPLATAKWVASVQELSGDRLLLGVGIGWMAAEFRAVGRSLKDRVRDSERVLKFLGTCFEEEVSTLNGESFLFRPQPTRPPIYVGGSAPHAIDRALKFGDGWMPMGRLESWSENVSEYRRRAEGEGRRADVLAFTSVSDDTTESMFQETLSRYETAGVTTLIVGRKYESALDWQRSIELLARCQESR